MNITGIKELEVPDVRVVYYERFHDNRGYFTETWRGSDMLRVAGIEDPVAQANESYSRRGTVRGLHFQWDPGTVKLVRVVTGHMIDVAVDVRQDSPTYGVAVAHRMAGASAQTEGEWIRVPDGFAHGCAFLENSIIEYLCTAAYEPRNQGIISPLADDIDWSRCPAELPEVFLRYARGGLLITDKDRQGHSMSSWSRSPDADKVTY